MRQAPSRAGRVRARLTHVGALALGVATLVALSAAPAQAATHHSVPGVPRHVSAAPEAAAAQVSFASPASTGGYPILGYRIVVHPTGARVTCRTTNCTVTGLGYHNSYSFSVAAFNRLGTGRYSSASNQVRPFAPARTVTFDANGGTGTMPSQTENLDVESTLTPNAFTRPGYVFTGWNTAPDGSGTGYADQGVYGFDVDVTLYAQWQKAAGDLTLTFDANGGSGAMTPETGSISTTVGLTLNTFTYTGYAFDGWNTSPDGTGTYYVNGASFTFSASATLYAQWRVAFDPTFSPGQSSSNWSGYVLSGQVGGYQAVSARWRVPVLNCALTPNASTSDWVGVNGDATVSPSGLFQDGTASDCQSGTQLNYAWWTDQAKNYLTQAVFSVSAGDMIEAQVFQDSSGHWNYYVKDWTTGEVSSSPEAYTGVGLTAEWIAEDPGNPATNGLFTLADFAPVTFRDLGLQVSGGTWYTPDVSDAYALTSSGPILAEPTAVLGSGTLAEFTVYYKPS